MNKLVLLIILITLLPLVASADDVEIDGIYFEFNEEERTASVVKYPVIMPTSPYKGDVIIPGEVDYNGTVYIVKSINFAAFEGSSELSSIIMSNSISSIDEKAFSGCTNLTSIAFPEGLKSIGQHAFEGCLNLYSFKLPSSLTSIGPESFLNTGWYNSLNDGPIFLDDWLLGYKGEKPSGVVVIKDGIKGIGGGAFYDCKNVTSIILPNSVNIIDVCAFQFCSGLTTITIPESVSVIGGSAFNACTNLASITIPYNVHKIGIYTFRNCRNMNSVSLPNSITEIGWGAFQGCENLTSITIPDGVTIIGQDAFNASGLKSISLPNSVTTIEAGAFSWCTSLASVNLPAYLTTINGYTFSSCYSLKNISIPPNVTYIGGDAFTGCSSLEYVKALSTTPPELKENSFSNYNIPLYVPESSLLLYKTTNPWNLFNEILAIDDDSETSVSGIGLDRMSDAQIFDLSGRHISKPSKGIYLIDGKKVLVK